MGLPITSTDNTILTYRTSAKFLADCVESLNTALENKEYDGCKLITYTNAKAKNWNEAIRNKLWVDNVPFVNGDRLIAKTPLFRESPDYLAGIKTHYKDKYAIACENSMEFSCTGEFVYCSQEIGGKKYPYYEVEAIADNGQLMNLRVLDDGFEIILDAQIKTAKNMKNWNLFKDLSCWFDNVSYAYAITCHKSQGSTYEIVYLDLDDLIKCKDRHKIVYTALTRASKQVRVFSVNQSYLSGV